MVKVRRVGNSSVMTLPRGLERLGYTPDSQVLVEELPSGQLLVTPAEKIRTRIRKIGRRVVAEDREALRILEAHDRRG
ncbi:MAG TPA: hypothetical protein VET82_02890 [Candidatus Eisenbacteria bacterium]|jgi:antitoxin component of MazEF toxin-antitoxin module|nr:hypothetical protein [Candidatus Eisenbacteria bacterium]